MSADPHREAELRRVLLVGFMGSGKTSVGRTLAEALDWRFVDFDDEIARQVGLTVPEIFQRHGEERFRETEAQVARALLAHDRVVLASGGGWAARPGRLDETPPGTETFWLRVSPDEAVRRIGSEPGTRPLLARADALEEATRLVAEREEYYRRAGWTVDTDGRTVEDVTARILEILARKHPGVTRTEVE